MDMVMWVKEVDSENRSERRLGFPDFRAKVLN